ncbi:MAG: phosphonate ABC transporter, permease protein PhnE [Clostridiales bacterium]|nr:MAG: phosphonate ABC transporter, permease protein PhnE [Clostridiales bacterium]
MNNEIKSMLNKEPNNRVKIAIYSLIVLAFTIWSSSTVEFKGLLKSGVDITSSIVGGILTPDFDMIFNLTKQGVPYLLLETLSIAFLGTIIGSILAIPFAFLSASNMTNKVIARIGSIIIAAIRTFPSFVYGLMFIRVTGPGAFAGVLTLSVVSIGMIAKLYIEAIEELDKGIIEALDAAGCTTFEKIRYGVIPQLFTIFISIVIYRFEINIRNASVLGLVGAGGIGAPLIFAMSSYKWHQVGAILFGLIVLVLIVEQLSSKLRNKLARG